jgi:hypothetical protein
VGVGDLTNSGTGFVHEVAAQHDPAAFLRLAGQQLISGGYLLTGHGPGWVSAQRPGRGYGIIGLDAAHAVTIRTNGLGVRFDLQNLARGWCRSDLPHLHSALGALMMAYDAALVQQSLFGPPSAAYPPPPSTHVVERQVVVTRCKFCRGHTPLDAPTCHHCGAAGFS